MFGRLSKSPGATLTASSPPFTKSALAVLGQKKHANRLPFSFFPLSLSRHSRLVESTSHRCSPSTRPCRSFPHAPPLSCKRPFSHTMLLDALRSCRHCKPTHTQEPKDFFFLAFCAAVLAFRPLVSCQPHGAAGGRELDPIIYIGAITTFVDWR